MSDKSYKDRTPSSGCIRLAIINNDIQDLTDVAIIEEPPPCPMSPPPPPR